MELLELLLSIAFELLGFVLEIVVNCFDSRKRDT
jgi:hypothetical protein